MIYSAIVYNWCLHYGIQQYADEIYAVVRDFSVPQIPSDWAEAIRVAAEHVLVTRHELEVIPNFH